VNAVERYHSKVSAFHLYRDLADESQCRDGDGGMYG
jgi:hypothetical protein